MVIAFFHLMHSAVPNRELKGKEVSKQAPHVGAPPSRATFLVTPCLTYHSSSVVLSSYTATSSPTYGDTCDCLIDHLPSNLVSSTLTCSQVVCLSPLLYPLVLCLGYSMFLRSGPPTPIARGLAPARQHELLPSLFLIISCSLSRQLNPCCDPL